MREYGAEQEVVVALRTRPGDAWGCLGLYREVGGRPSTTRSSTCCGTSRRHLAEGARRALLIGEATDPEGPDAPGLVVLREDWSVESVTPGVERWLAELPDGDWEASDRLPPAVVAVAGRARRTAGRAPRRARSPWRACCRLRSLGGAPRRVAGVRRRDRGRR